MLGILLDLIVLPIKISLNILSQGFLGLAYIVLRKKNESFSEFKKYVLEDKAS